MVSSTCLDFLIFLCYLPISKHSHLLAAPLNVFFRRLQPTGVLQPIPNIEEREVFGVGKVTDFSWKQMLDFYTCTECGRCEVACPASATGKDLSPKKIMHDMRYVVEARGAPVAPGFDVTQPQLDRGRQLQLDLGLRQLRRLPAASVPCFIEHVPTLVDMRRFLVMDEASMPETAPATLEQLEQRGHPWRGTPLTRTTWMEQMESTCRTSMASRSTSTGSAARARSSSAT